jgi:sialate O-acetylesterase
MRIFMRGRLYLYNPLTPALMKRLHAMLLTLAYLATGAVYADVRLPKIFGNSMVLQRRKPVPVWGWATPKENVTVQFANQTKTIKAAPDGRWQLNLDALEAGGPFVLTVKGAKNTIQITDVLVGEVWICSGQSNMEWRVAQTNNARAEIRAAKYPTIRQFLVKKDLSLTPKDDIEAGSWAVCSPQTVPNFTAVGYFFARDLAQKLNVPIGLINTSWGGTHSETWTSREALMRDDELRQHAESIPTDVEGIKRSGMARIEKLIQNQQGSLPTAAEVSTWAKPDYDAKAWKTANQPGDWEWYGLPVLDGVVWFRRDVIIDEGADLSGLVLHLGAVDDADSTYVNGQLVGSTKAYGGERNYTLPAGLMKPGRNVIAVRVTDTGGQGGFVGPAAKMELEGPGFQLFLSGKWQYRVAQVFESSYQPGPNTYATLLFNAMLKPLIPYAIGGTIWYQGESNASRANQYRRAFPMMIQDWRTRWGYDFPFLFVQLANFNSAGGNSSIGSAWAELREAQTMTLSLPNTGMAVTSDIGEPTDIHPRNKQDVGKRLAAEALRVAYKQETSATVEVSTGEASRGPMFSQMQVTENRAILTFKNTGMGLVAKDRYGYLKGFELAGADQKFHYAQAHIEGDRVIVQCEAVAAPVAVRYGWADDNGDVNLYNRDGFPAVPFRTDSWKGITEGVKF